MVFLDIPMGLLIDGKTFAKLIVSLRRPICRYDLFPKGLAGGVEVYEAE